MIGSQKCEKCLISLGINRKAYLFDRYAFEIWSVVLDVYLYKPMFIPFGYFTL